MSTTRLGIKQAKILNMAPSPTCFVALGFCVLFCKMEMIVFIFRAVFRIKEDKCVKDRVWHRAGPQPETSHPPNTTCFMGSLRPSLS